MAKFSIDSASYSEWIARLETYIPGLDKCTDNIQVAEAVNGYRGMIRANSRQDRETYRFLTKHCGYDHTQVAPTKH